MKNNQVEPRLKLIYVDGNGHHTMKDTIRYLLYIY